MYETSEEKTKRLKKECIDSWKNLTLWGWIKLITVLLAYIGFITFISNDGFDWLNGLFK
jgi:hypothetical protein